MESIRLYNMLTFFEKEKFFPAQSAVWYENSLKQHIKTVQNCIFFEAVRGKFFREDAGTILPE